MQPEGILLLQTGQLWSDGSSSSRPPFKVPSSIQSGRSGRQITNGKLTSKSGIDLPLFLDDTGADKEIKLSTTDFNIPSEDPAGTKSDAYICRKIRLSRVSSKLCNSKLVL